MGTRSRNESDLPLAEQPNENPAKPCRKHFEVFFERLNGVRRRAIVMSSRNAWTTGIYKEVVTNPIPWIIAAAGRSFIIHGAIPTHKVSTYARLGLQEAFCPKAGSVCFERRGRGQFHFRNLNHTHNCAAQGAVGPEAFEARSRVCSLQSNEPSPPCFEDRDHKP
jgi:hypothetical protein